MGSHKRRFIFGVIQSPEEALNDPQFAHRGFFVEQEHPAMGAVKFPGAPFNMESTPWQDRKPGAFHRAAQQGNSGAAGWATTLLNSRNSGRKGVI